MRIRKTPILNIKIDVVDSNDSASNASFEVHSMNKMWISVKKILSEDTSCSKTISCWLDGKLIKSLTRKPLNEGKKFGWYIHNAVKETNRRIVEKAKRNHIEAKPQVIELPQQNAQDKKAKVLVG